MVDLDKSGIVELSEFRKLLWKIFKAVYEARVKQEEEKRRKEESSTRMTMYSTYHIVK